MSLRDIEWNTHVNATNESGDSRRGGPQTTLHSVLTTITVLRQSPARKTSLNDQQTTKWYAYDPNRPNPPRAHRACQLHQNIVCTKISVAKIRYYRPNQWRLARQGTRPGNQGHSPQSNTPFRLCCAHHTAPPYKTNYHTKEQVKKSVPPWTRVITTFISGRSQ